MTDDSYLTIAVAKTLLKHFPIKYDEESYIDIDFRDVDGFDNDKLMLCSLRDIDEFSSLDCDFLVALEKIPGVEFGNMDTEKPILHLNIKYFKSKNAIKNNRSQIKDTLLHELTHYLQYQHRYMNNNGETGLRGAKPYHRLSSKEINDAKSSSRAWYICSIMIDYALQKEERGARISGTYFGLKDDYAKMYKKWEKKNKLEQKKNISGDKQKKDETPDKQKFFKQILDDNDLTLFVNYINDFIKQIKNDTYDDFTAAVNSSDKYPTNSVVFSILYLMDHSSSEIDFPKPSRQNYVANITSKEKFEQYKKKCLQYSEREFRDYKKKLYKMFTKLDSELNV